MLDIAENTETNDVNIYPNPNSGNFIIESSEKIFSVEVRNILGEKIYSAKPNANKTELDLSNHSKGIYFVEIVYENEKEPDNYRVRKIVLQ